MSRTKDYPYHAYLLNSGSSNMNVNGSVTPVEFTHTPTENVTILRVIGQVQPIKMLGGSPVLTNGIAIDLVLQDGTVVDLTGGRRIYGDIGWLGLMHEVDYPMDIIDYVVRWDFSKPGTEINLTAGDTFRITINDNLTGMTNMRFMLQGRVD
ncbi:MAG: hypothetical protein R2761_23575 [Acidimicrobiales bacterium]